MVGEAIKIYLKQIKGELGEFGKDFMILFNGTVLNINDNRTIEDITYGKNDIIFTVYDLGNIIGA